MRLLSEPAGEPLLVGGGFRRFESRTRTLRLTTDRHESTGMAFHQVRTPVEGLEPGRIIELDCRVNRVSESPEAGRVVGVTMPTGEGSVWMPDAPRRIEFDEHGRIAATADVPCVWTLEPGKPLELRIEDPGSRAGMVVFPAVSSTGADRDLFRELTPSDCVEIRRYSKSSWFVAQEPLDFWRYFVAGSIYDIRTNGAPGKRFRCQQCAFSWWKYFGLLFRETRKPLWNLLQDLVAFSVLADLPPDGAWRHGYWSDAMEVHARFQLDGLLLLLAQHRKTQEPAWLEAAERGMDFVAENLGETLEDGSLWFLHDTIEHTRHHHFRSRLFGKSEGNSLCINTHVQALTVLQRLQAASPRGARYRELYERGIQALRRGLELQPAQLLYRPLLWWIFQSIRDPRQRSRVGWVVRRVERRLQQRLYWALRTRWPRLRQPGGFTERDLTLEFASDRYHLINLKDFLTLYEKDRLDWLLPCIVQGMDFLRRLIGRWGLEFAVKRSPYYIEYVDVLQLYERCIGTLLPGELEEAQKLLVEKVGTHSLDYQASGLDL